MQIVLPSEVRVWLKFAIGGSVREFAAHADMSPQYIYAVLRGEKEPSPLLLEKAGLEVVYRVRVVSRRPQKKNKADPGAVGADDKPEKTVRKSTEEKSRSRRRLA